jgi:hypothetical protein
MRKCVSNPVPNNLTQANANTAYDAFVGQFDRCMIGKRTQIVREVSRVAADSTGPAFTDGQIWIRISFRADVELAYTTAFVVLNVFSSFATAVVRIYSGRGCGGPSAQPQPWRLGSPSYDGSWAACPSLPGSTRALCSRRHTLGAATEGIKGIECEIVPAFQVRRDSLQATVVAKTGSASKRKLKPRLFHGASASL